MESPRAGSFEQATGPHLDAAYNLARWLTRDPHDADDVVQEAYLRAYKFFHSFDGGDGRAWLLTIVRNTCYTWLRQNRGAPTVSYDEQLHDAAPDQPAEHQQDPQALLLRESTAQQLTQAMQQLPLEFREVLVLRELQDLSYQDIAAVTGLPAGTVMSRLSRARRMLRTALLRLDPETP